MKQFLKTHQKLLKLIGHSIILFLFWLIPYLSFQGFIDNNVGNIFEYIAIISIGLYGGLLLSFKRDCFDVFTLICFTPFVFARPFDAMSIPIPLFIALGFVLIGFIVSWIRFRPKLHIGPFFFGILTLGIALVLGGLWSGKTYFSSLIFILPVVAGILLIFVYFISLSNVSFKDLSFIMFFLSVYLVLQCLVYFLTRSNILQGFLEKGVDVGWGISNNVGTILLLLIPFSMYLVVSLKGYRSTVILSFVVLFMVMMLFTHSRGAIAALGIIVIPLFIYCGVKSKQKLRFFLSTTILLVIVAGGFGICYLVSKEYFNTFFHNLFSNLDTIDSRIEIYKDFFEEVKKQIIFGYGVLAPLNHQVGDTVGYQWGHGTFIHTFYTMGLVGVLALIYHLGEKYFVLFKKHTLPCIITFFAFIGSGLYGLIDVSYYFINYMILLIIILVVVSNEYIKKEESL